MGLTCFVHADKLGEGTAEPSLCHHVSPRLIFVCGKKLEVGGTTCIPNPKSFIKSDQGFTFALQFEDYTPFAAGAADAIRRGEEVPLKNRVEKGE